MTGAVIGRILQAMSASIQVGDRVYLANAVAGEPGVVVVISGEKAEVHWPDLPELARNTKHRLNTLILDEGFMARSKLDYETAAA